MVQEDRRNGSEQFARLRMAVAEARADLAEIRGLDRPDRRLMVASQQRLLSALQTYILAIEAAGFTPQWQLRTEANLLRAVVEDSGRPHRRRP